MTLELLESTELDYIDFWCIYRGGSRISGNGVRWWVGLQTLSWFWLKDLSIGEIVGPDALAVCQAHRGLPVGFLLLPYSVLFTVESLSLLYLLVISWFICFRRWCIDKLGIFHSNQYLCILVHIWIKGEVGAVKLAEALQLNILLTVPRRYFFCGSFMVFFPSCVCYVFVHVCLYVLWGHLLGKAWPLCSCLWCLTVSLSLSHWYAGSGVVFYCIDSWS